MASNSEYEQKQNWIDFEILKAQEKLRAENERLYEKPYTIITIKGILGEDIHIFKDNELTHIQNDNNRDNKEDI